MAQINKSSSLERPPSPRFRDAAVRENRQLLILFDMEFRFETRLVGNCSAPLHLIFDSYWLMESGNMIYLSQLREKKGEKN